MKKIATLFVGMLIVVGGFTNAHAQISTRQQQAEQDALDAKTPKLNYTEEVLQLLVPGMTMAKRSASTSIPPVFPCGQLQSGIAEE